MKKAIIFCNGDLPSSQKVLSHLDKSDFIICANGGTKHALKLNLIPNVVIGDCDSLPSNLKKQLKKHPVKFIKHSEDKDQTDLELALDYLTKKKFKKILVFGAFGLRADHVLANFLLLSSPNYTNASIAIINGNQEITLVKKNHLIQGKKGDLLSLIPLKEDCRGITTKGLKYQLKNGVLYFSSTRGVSNVLTHPQAEIKIKKGTLLVIHSQR
jgi:thiamine pyrophosphokinase